MNIIQASKSDPNLLESTKQTYRSILERYHAVYGDHISVASVQAWLDSLNCGASTKRLYVAALKHADQRLVLTHHRAPAIRDQTFSVGRARGRRPQPRALGLSEIQALLGTCQGRDPLEVRDRAILGLFLTTGMRHGALCKLNRPDVDLRRKMVRIYLKGGSEHLAPLSQEASGYLKPWLGWKPQVTWQVAPDPVGPLFVELQSYRRLAYRSVAAVVARRASQAGIGHLEVHELRHTMITRARLAGWSALEIAAVTGHVTDLEGESRTIDRVYTDLERAGQEWGRGDDRLT
jgi:integrase